MEWYKIYQFKEHLENIEQFFIEMVANEEQLLTFGFKRALVLPTAEKAFEALKTFDEDFSTLKRFMIRMDRSLGRELERLDAEEKLVEQVSLIALRLRMAAARKPISAPLALINQVSFYLPYFSRLIQSKGFFGEEPVSLQKTIINVGRLQGLTNVCSEFISSQNMADDEVFKPSNVNHDHILDMIDTAVAEIEHLISISPTDRERIQGYLQEAKKEVLSSAPSWSKIVGALVIVATITSGIADAPNTAKNIKNAIEYILGTSVEKPLQKYLPSPREDREPSPPIRI